MLDRFYAEYGENCSRKGFKSLPRATLEGLESLVHAGHAVLFVEGRQGQIANMAIVDACGVPCYVLGTRTRDHVAGGAGGAAQFLQFEIMKRLRDQKKRYYDLGGCEGPVPVQEHRNYGTWHFKYGFRGTYVEFLPYARKACGTVARALLNQAHRMRGDPT
jgi:hypothetical protein